MSNTYQIETTVQLSAAFRQVVGGELVDPPAVTLNLSAPDGTISTVTYPGTITRDGIGLYHFDVTPTESGPWNYQWQGSGGTDVTSAVSTFCVEPSIFIPG